MAYEQELGSADRYYDAIKSYRRMNAAKTKTKIWVEQVSDAQEIFDFLQNEHSGFLNSMREAIINYGGLTEGQANAVRKIIADRAAKAAAWAAEGAASAWVGVEGDRIAFDLTVQHVVELEGMYGITYINICKDADENVVIYKGSNYWGKGAQVKCLAKVKGAWRAQWRKADHHPASNQSGGGKMNTHNLWTLLRNNLKMKMYRVGGTEGMPNVHYLGSGKFPMGFMQIIHVGDWSKRVSTGLRKEQVKWMNEYIDQGGSAWIVVRIGRDFTGLFWGGDSEAIFVRPSSQDFVKIAAWSKSGNMVEQDWEDIQNIILNANSD
jgi:hypothetical protein